MKKRLFIMGFTLLGLFFASCLIYFQPALANTNPIKVVINSETLAIDANPVNINGRVLVPLRGIFEHLGAFVDWDNQTGTIRATKLDDEILLKINNNNASVNGKTISLDAPPIIIEGHTMVSVRFIAESLGAQVKWDPSIMEVDINLLLEKEKYSDEQLKRALVTNAIIDKMNNFDFEVLGGGEQAPELIKQRKMMLEYWWEVNDRESALSAIAWLIEKGHRKEYDMYILQIGLAGEEGYNATINDPTQPQEYINFLKMVKEHLQEYNNDVDVLFEKSINAWDFCRLINVTASSYYVGYISEDEAWKIIMPAAQYLQATFSSWEEMGKNYAYGRRFWNGELVYQECINVIEWLKTNSESPWLKYKWDLSLEPNKQ